MPRFPPKGYFYFPWEDREYDWFTDQRFGCVITFNLVTVHNYTLQKCKLFIDGMRIY